jgi:hypothetical protein
VRILGWLAYPGTISAVLWPTVRLVRTVLEYRLGCKVIEARERRGLDPGSQSPKAVRARHACRRLRG